MSNCIFSSFLSAICVLPVIANGDYDRIGCSENGIIGQGTTCQFVCDDNYTPSPTRSSVRCIAAGTLNDQPLCIGNVINVGILH